MIDFERTASLRQCHDEHLLDGEANRHGNQAQWANIASGVWEHKTNDGANQARVVEASFAAPITDGTFMVPVPGRPLPYYPRARYVPEFHALHQD